MGNNSGTSNQLTLATTGNGPLGRPKETLSARRRPDLGKPPRRTSGTAGLPSGLSCWLRHALCLAFVYFSLCGVTSGALAQEIEPPEVIADPEVSLQVFPLRDPLPSGVVVLPEEELKRLLREGEIAPASLELEREGADTSSLGLQAAKLSVLANGPSTAGVTADFEEEGPLLSARLVLVPLDAKRSSDGRRMEFTEYYIVPIEFEGAEVRSWYGSAPDFVMTEPTRVRARSLAVGGNLINPSSCCSGGGQNVCEEVDIPDGPGCGPGLDCPYPVGDFTEEITFVVSGTPYSQGQPFEDRPDERFPGETSWEKSDGQVGVPVVHMYRRGDIPVDQAGAFGFGVPTARSVVCNECALFDCAGPRN